MSNKKNAVKLLPKIDSVDNYVILYTEFDGFFDIGDRLYIMAIDTSSDEYQYLDSINNYNSTSDKMGFVVLDKIGNSIKINRKYDDLSENIDTIKSDCYIGTVYIKNSTIKTGYINSALLNNVILDTNENDKLRIMQCVLSKLNGDTINNTILEKKYNKSDLILKTDIIDDNIESYYTYNNYDNGLTIINLSDNRLDINGTDIYDGIINNCDIYTNTIIDNFPDNNNLMGHWSFDDLSGEIILGNLNKDITLYNGDVLVNGISGNAVFRYLVSDSTGIGILNDINLNHNTDFSMSVWFKLERYNGYDTSLYTTSVLSFENDNYNFGIYINKPGSSPILKFGVNGVNDSNDNILSLDYGITYNTWYHCVFVNDNGIINQYINGEFISGMTNNIEYGDIFDVLIGYNKSISKNDFSAPFRGSIDEFRIYDKILTGDEIKILYDNPGGDFSLKKYIYSGLLNNCNINDGYIIKGGTFNDCTVSSLTIWKNGKWINNSDDIVDNPFKCKFWENGTWEGGTFPNSYWNDGTFVSGIFNGDWNNGIFINGTFDESNWSGGTFNDGLFKNSNWYGGIFDNGTFENSNWLNGTFNNGLIKEDSNWSDGIFNNGLIKDSNWSDGIFNNGTFEKSNWSGGTFNDGVFGEDKFENNTNDTKSYWYGGVFHGGQIKNSDWYGGKFYYGSIFNTDWYGGEMYYGISNGIKWYDGVWYDGIVNDIEWYDGIWYNGIFNYGNFHDGIWYDGSFNGGYFGVRNEEGERVEPYPIWYNGNFYYGQFNGIWSGGTFYIGDLKEDENLIPSRYYVGKPYTQYNKKLIQHNITYNKKIPKLRRF